MRILIADDEKDLRESLEFLLGKPNREFDIVSDGKAAYALMKSISYDLVILDILMPGMNGRDVISMSDIWSLNNKIVVITGFTQFEYLKDYDSVIEVILKPFSIEQIEAIINEQENPK